MIDNQHIKGSIIAGDFYIAIHEGAADALEDLAINLALIPVGCTLEVGIEATRGAWSWYKTRRYVARVGDNVLKLDDAIISAYRKEDKKRFGREPTEKQIIEGLTDILRDTARGGRAIRRASPQRIADLRRMGYHIDESEEAARILERSGANAHTDWARGMPQVSVPGVMKGLVRKQVTCL